MAATSAVVVGVFYWLARSVGSGQPLRDTALLVLGPAFLPGQNLMMDVPTLLCWLICLRALLGLPGRPSTRRLAVGALALAAGLLIKYTSLVLLPIFALTLVRRGQWRQLWVLAIPLAALAGWSLFNLSDYGGVHILTRSVGELRLSRYLAQSANWVAGLGALSPFTLMFLPRLPARRWWLLASGLAGAAIWAAMAYRTQSLGLGLAWAGLLVNGGLALALVVYAGCRRNGWPAGRSIRRLSLLRWRRPRADASPLPVNADGDSTATAGLAQGCAEVGAPTDDVDFILGLWLAGAGAFIVLFAPLMAIRHGLLAVPPVLLLLRRNLHPGRQAAWAGLAVTAALGLWLAASDFAYAAVYPAYAAQIAAGLPAGGTHWAVGHWGWQWYA